MKKADGKSLQVGSRLNGVRRFSRRFSGSGWCDMNADSREAHFSQKTREMGHPWCRDLEVAHPPMVNETLCKILCHNLVVLIHEMCELGIDPVFWCNEASPA
jgi:hypothetical protein